MMKKLLVSLLSALLCMTVAAKSRSNGNTEQNNPDNNSITIDKNGDVFVSPLWFHISDEGTAEVIWNRSYKNMESVVIPSEIKIAGHVYPVTSIEKYAFLGCKSLTNVKISSGLKSIGDGAFSFCKGLTSINIPSSVTNIGKLAFLECECLTSIKIPSSVTNIGSSAFLHCKGLTSINVSRDNKFYSSDKGILYDKNKTTLICIPEGKNGSIVIPSSVTHINSFAFNNCRELTSINVSRDNSNYSSEDGILYDKNKTALICAPKGKKGNIKIPSGVTSIEKEAFSYCRYVTNIKIPFGVTSIGEWAFRCCGLTTIEIPSSVTSIGECAFWVCTDLTSIDIPSSVTSIGEQAFSSCNGLTSINIPSSVTSIGNEAFNDCIVLTNINVSRDNMYYSSEEGILYDKNKTTLICTPGGRNGSIKIPSGVTRIGENAFSGCWRLTNISIPSSVTSIGSSAFRGCRSLTNIDLPSGVTSIGKNAFYGCENLEIVIDNSKENVIVEENTFEGCKSVKYLK